MAPIKSKPLEGDIYVAPPLFSEPDPTNSWKLVKPLYGLPTAFREWYLVLGGLPVSLFRWEGDFVR